MKKAYDNWMNVIEYDGKALLNSKPSKKTTPTLQNEAPPVPANYPASYDQHVSQTHISALAPLEHQPSTDTGIPGGGEELREFSILLFGFSTDSVPIVLTAFQLRSHCFRL